MKPPDQPPKPKLVDTSNNLLSSYSEAKAKDKLVRYHLDRLISFRDDSSDELPTEDIANLVKAGKPFYKLRGNYLFGLCGTLSLLLEDNLITEPALVGKVKQFIKHEFNVTKGKYTVKEEIDMMNQILAEVIVYLETKR